MITKFILVSFAVLSTLASCKKEKQSPEPITTVPVPFAYTELKSERAGISIGQTTLITAVASGENLVYNWSCTAGTLVGQGAEVTYGSTCASCRGLNTITCTVSDGRTTGTKTVQVNIK